MTRDEKDKEKLLKKVARAHSARGDEQVATLCKSCKVMGHSSARSPLCQNYKAPKEDQVRAIIGEFTSVTRKIKLETILQQEYKSSLTETIRNVSSQVRQILFRCQLFVNHYIIEKGSFAISDKVFEQNFWYSCHQLVIGKEVSNKKSIPDDLIDYWKEFDSKYNITYNDSLEKGYSQCLSPACVEVSTAYKNHVVEMFEQRLIKFLTRKITSVLPDEVCLSSRRVKFIVKAICKLTCMYIYIVFKG